MATSSKKLPSRLRSQQFDQNINKRGKVTQKVEKEEKSRLGPVVVGVLLFVVVGSALFQIIRTAQIGSGGKL
jgi:hypothetical protein